MTRANSLGLSRVAKGREKRERINKQYNAYRTDKEEYYI